MHVHLKALLLGSIEADVCVCVCVCVGFLPSAQAISWKSTGGKLVQGNVG